MDIQNPELAEKGRLRINWAAQAMPVLESIRNRFKSEKPLDKVRIAACLHVTTETAVLMQTLKDGGANLRLCASNPLSTQDDVAASLSVNDGIDVFAVHGEDRDMYYNHINQVLAFSPQLTMDDGADLINQVHQHDSGLAHEIIGGTEETTTGVIRLKSMAETRVLKYPVIAVNDADTKHMFDNRYGTGQSTIDGIVRATNRLLAGAVFVVCGYGWCGRGVADRARGMGARVMVTEVDPIRALEAVMNGFQVMPMAKAATMGDFFCTVSGDIRVINSDHLVRMKDGAVICNSGHFNVEIDLEALEQMSKNRREIRNSLEEFCLKNGRRIYLVGQGRLVNLAAAEGHPASVMDMSFANQALCSEYLLQNAAEMNRRVYHVPKEIDRRIAELKLKAMGTDLDVLTDEQKRYLHSWEQGT